MACCRGLPQFFKQALPFRKIMEVTISEILGAVMFYAFLFAGSVTMGYLFLRLTHPEVRTLPRKQKTRNAFLTGAGFLVVAIIVDIVLNGFENVVRVNSFTLLVASLLAGITFVVFNIVTSLKTRPLVVGIRLPENRPRVAHGLAYVEEVVIKPPPLVARELPEEATATATIVGGLARSGKSVHEKLEELKRAGAIQVEKPVVEKPAVEKPELEKPSAITAPAAALKPAAVAATPAGTPAGAPVKKPGFFARLFGGKAKTKPVATAAVAAPAGGSRGPSALAPVKKEETEIEVIVKELGLVEEKPGGAKPVGRLTAPPGGERHRLYLRAKEAGEERKAGKALEIQKEREEVGEFVKDIYSQLKAEQKPEGLREKVGVRQPRRELREKGIPLHVLFTER